MTDHEATREISGGEKQMKKTVTVIALALLAVAMLATPLVSAVPLKEKNNDKFESFHVDFLVSAVTFLQGEHNFIPSMDNVNILTIDGPEAFISYDITVGSKTYHMGEDFIYTGHFEYTFYDVTAWLTIPNVLPPYVWPSEYRARHFVVDYMYEFLPASGIEGTIQLRAVANQRGIMYINSLAGTGDLGSVQIKAFVSSEVQLPNSVYFATHDGTVIGWPT